MGDATEARGSFHSTPSALNPHPRGHRRHHRSRRTMHPRGSSSRRSMAHPWERNS
jgi:hypothetical protein